MDKSCRGCGSVLDLTQEQIRQAVDEVLEETRPEIKPLPGVCPLCGRSSAVPVSHRKSVHFALLLALLVLASALAIAYYARRDTERQQIARQALQQAQANPNVVGLLGTPITVRGDIGGQVKEDETGWQEARLTVPILGPRAEGVLNVIGGRATGEWRFTTFEVLIPSARKRVDLISGRVVEHDPEGYVEVHTLAASTPDYTRATVPPARWSGNFPCVSVPATSGTVPRIGDCTPPVPIQALKGGSLDRFEVDLRVGKFTLRQTDLLLKDGDLQVPLTRTYTSRFRMHTSRITAFGRNALHDFDIAPIGSRNPYLHMFIVLPDDDFLYFPRISRGTGYADAVYQHSETSSAFYAATIAWNGNGWETKLADGARIDFPESYNAKTMAQGAPTQLIDAHDNKVQLIRDPQRNLKEIRAPRGHWIKFHYDEQSRVIRAEDNEGRWVKYAYDPDGMLANVTHSDGRARYYTYVGDLLTSVRDEKGRVLIRNSYRDARVVRQDYSNGDSYRIDYTIAPNQLYAEEARVVLPDDSIRSFRTGDSVQWVIKSIKP
jgi:YD repeat-containing protein